MGNRGISSSRAEDHYRGNTQVTLGQGQRCLTLSDDRAEEQKDWDVVFRGDAKEWKGLAGFLGLDQYQVECLLGSELCDRDYVCSGYLCVMYRRWTRVLHVKRFNQKSFSVPVGSHPGMARLLASAMSRRLLVVAMLQDVAVLEILVGNRRHAFPIMDCSKKCIKAVYTPDFSLTLIEGAITPDLSHTGLLLYCQSQDSHFFTYDLFLISNKSGELICRTCLSQGSVQPHFAFHPLYRNSRVAVTQYRKDCNSKLVILSLKDGKIMAMSSPHLSFIMGMHQLFARFSPDGRFLLLQKLSDDRFGVTSFCDMYIFNVSENTFHLVKYISSKIPGIFYSCRVCFQPEFSRCGQYMRVLSTAKTVNVLVFSLPKCMDLMARCRQVILGCMPSEKLVVDLPIPNRLKDFLLFKPVYDS